jgi:hypothetical protein
MNRFESYCPTEKQQQYDYFILLKSGLIYTLLLSCVVFIGAFLFFGMNYSKLYKHLTDVGNHEVACSRINMEKREQSSHMHMYLGASFAHHFCVNSVTEVRILAYENRSLFTNKNTLIQSSDYRWFPGSRELVFLSKESLLDLSHLRFTQSCFYELLQFKCHIIVDHTTPPTSHIAFERKEPPTLLLIIAFVVFFIISVFICIFFIAIGLVTLIWVVIGIGAICFGIPSVLLLLTIE